MSQSQFSSLAELYRNSGYSQFPLDFRSQGSLPVTFIRAEQQAHDFVDPPVADMVLQTILRTKMTFRWDLGDGWKPIVEAHSGGICVAPPKTEIRYECHGDHDILLLAVPSDGVQSMIDQEGISKADLFAPVCGPLFRDEVIRTAVLRMWAESANSSRASSLMVDGLLQTILAQLLRRSEKSGPPPAYKMSTKTLALIDDYIEEKELLGLTIKELAQVAGLSEFQFARDFKETTGVTPHQYVLERRILRARELLADPKLPLADVAYACGFSSQSHMTDTFRERLGITPGRYRAEIVS